MVDEDHRQLPEWLRLTLLGKLYSDLDALWSIEGNERFFSAEYLQKLIAKKASIQSSMGRQITINTIFTIVIFFLVSGISVEFKFPYFNTDSITSLKVIILFLSVNTSVFLTMEFLHDICLGLVIRNVVQKRSDPIGRRLYELQYNQSYDVFISLFVPDVGYVSGKKALTAKVIFENAFGLYFLSIFFAYFLIHGFAYFQYFSDKENRELLFDIVTIISVLVDGFVVTMFLCAARLKYKFVWPSIEETATD